MSNPSLSSRLKPSQPRRLQFMMRDGVTIEGQVQIGEDQSLSSYLNSRRGGWMNLARAMRAKGDEYPGHMILQGDHIVFVSVPDGNVQVANAQIAGIVERAVEIVLLGGRMIQGYMPAAPQQRLSDVVSSAGRFVAVTKARLLPDERPLGDIVLHTGAIEFVRDSRMEAALSADATAADSDA